MSRRLLAAAAPLLLALAPACLEVKGRIGAPFPEWRVGEIEDGVTTRAQIVSWFGPPSAFFRPGLLDLILGEADAVPPGVPIMEDVYTYRYIESNARLLFFPLLWGDARVYSDSSNLIVFFDEKGIVQYHGFRRDRNRASPRAGRDER